MFGSFFVYDAQARRDITILIPIMHQDGNVQYALLQFLSYKVLER